MNESFGNMFFEILEYNQPNNIIKICKEFKKDFFSNYCDKKNINFMAIDYDFKQLFHSENNLIFKNFSLNNLSFLNQRDLIIIENDPNKSKCWENIEIILKSLSKDKFPMIFFIDFLKLKFLDNGVIHGNLINTYDFLEKLVLFSEQENIDLTLQILSSDICCVYLVDNKLNQIFENHVNYFGSKEGYFNQFLFKDLEIIKSKKEISQLKYLNSQWVNRNSILTKTKEDLIIQNEILNIRNEELVELNSQWINRNSILSKTKYSLINENNELYKNITNKDSLIQDLESKLSIQESQIKNFESKLSNKENEILNAQADLETMCNSLNLLKHESHINLNKLNSKDYCIKCFKEELENNHVEINYLKNDSIFKKILNPFAYVFLFLKSNREDLKLNFKLYNALKNRECFDIGFYLNNNKDICESKWCKYFSPELHYVCNGFDEKRKFNKKYHDCNSKKDLLDYILNCTK